MSHSVTITRTVTSSNTTSTLVLNTGYLRTCPGLLKLAELVNIDSKMFLVCFCEKKIEKCCYNFRSLEPYVLESLLIIMIVDTLMQHQIYSSC